MGINLTCPLLPPPLSPAQDPHQPGLQQHRHSGGSQEKRLSAELGETALEKQRHSAAELTAATHPRYERIAAPQYGAAVAGDFFKGPMLYQVSSWTLPVKTNALLWLSHARKGTKTAWPQGGLIGRNKHLSGAVFVLTCERYQCPL